MGIRAMVGRPTALRNAAMVSGNSVYPISDTDCMKDLETMSALAPRLMNKTKVNGREGCPHISAEKFDLEGNDSLADPY